MLGKKLWLAAILNLLDGPVNAALALASQGIDTGLLLYMRPYADRRTDVTESLGGITNLLVRLLFGVSLCTRILSQLTKSLGRVSWLCLSPSLSALIWSCQGF